ncbi:hypothetical protein ACSBR1_043499 [Camellia fascicularis]
MEGCFMLMCKYSKSCAAIKISEGCSYHEVVEKICAKFKELNVGNCCLFFSIPRYSNCIVECDDDLGNMMSMVASSGSYVVDLVVGDRKIVEVDDNSSRINSVICESSLVNDCDDFGDFLPSFYPEPERVLLSASWKGIIHSVGQEFNNGVPAFRIALTKYAVKCGFAMNYLKNDATRVTAEYLVAKWLVLDLSLILSIMYLETGMRTNPGSVFELDVDESSGYFRRLFVTFRGCLYGFQFCRSLLFVDGTFLKGHYKRHLLVATLKDGNQGLFLLAFAIVDAENQDNWM